MNDEPNSTPSEASDVEGHSKRNPWSYVPVLYFLQGVPVMIIQGMAGAMYTKLGVGTGPLGLWTSLLKLPWMLKPLWAPFVEVTSTKRHWIVAMQILISGTLVAAAFTITRSWFFAGSIGVFFVTAFLSSTHDIAADGFYLLALDKQRQAFFVGIRSAAFRLGTLFATFGLVYLAGDIEERSGNIPHAWFVALLVGAGVYGLFAVINAVVMPHPPADHPGSAHEAADLVPGLKTLGRLVLLVAGVWLVPLLAERFLEGRNDALYDALVANHSVVVAFQWVVDLGGAYLILRALARSGNSSPVTEAFVSFFRQDRIVAILGFILFFRFGESMISTMSAPFLLKPVAEGGMGISTKAQGALGGAVGVIALTVGGLLGGWVISKWGIKRSVWPMVLSLNLPNLAYIWLASVRPPSHIDATLAAAPENLALFSGAWFSYVGTVFSSAFSDPIGLVIAVDQFGYGFGLSAYLVYLMFVSQGSRYPTSNYAVATGLMALGALVAGSISGYLQEAMARSHPGDGFLWFFIAVMFFTIPGMAVLFFIPMAQQDIKEAHVEID